MKRRGFLGFSVAALAALGVWRYVRSSDYDAIIAIIEKRLDYLKKDPEGVRAYAAELARRHEITSGRLRVVSMAKPLYEFFSLTDENRFTNNIHHGEERVVSSYLLSSDFFVNGADTTRTVRYIGFYDPFHACGNPFARLGDG